MSRADGPGLRHRHTTPEDQLSGLLHLHGLLAKVAEAVGPTTDLQPMLEEVLRALRGTVAFRGGSIGLVQDGLVYLAATDPPVGPELLEVRLPVGTGLMGRVVSTGRPVYSADVDADDRVDPRLRALAAGASLRSYLAVPLICLRQVIGFLQIDSTDVDAFDDYDLEVLQGIAAQIGGAIESARRLRAAAALERQKSDFVGRVSHELRTPLTVIAGLATTLRAHQDDLSREQRMALLDRLEDATARLRGLVEELLAVGTATSEPLHPEPTSVDLVAVCEEAAEASADPERVGVEAAGEAYGWLDRRIVAQALGLLVDNALRYGRACLLRVEPGRYGRVLVHVDDDGPGVPPGDRERIFERFTRGEHHGEPGMGLGLPLARSLLASVDGWLQVSDSPEGGARFTIAVPAGPRPRIPGQ